MLLNKKLADLMESEDHKGPNSFQQIKFESGEYKETKISIVSYEMYETELLDRSLLSLQRTEEACMDINNRIIENVNQRKERINELNKRILGLS